MATAALIGGVMTKMFTGENPKDSNDYIFPRVGGVNPDGSPRRLTTMFYLREIPMLYPGIRRRRRYALGRRRHVVSKLLFEPFMEIWDTNAPGYQRVQQSTYRSFAAFANVS